jgi:hypothetical protein
MKIITKTLIATSMTIAMSLVAQQSGQTPAQAPSSSDKSSSEKSSTSSSDKSSSQSSADQQKPKGGTDSQTESTAGGQSSQTITSLQQLSTSGTSDPTSLQGKRVDLKDAKVQQVLGQDTITITSDEPGKEILVKSQSPVESIKAGQTISVRGSIRQMPQDPSQLGLDSTASQKIQGQKFYIQARQVKASEQQQ